MDISEIQVEIWESTHDLCIDVKINDGEGMIARMFWCALKALETITISQSIKKRKKKQVFRLRRNLQCQEHSEKVRTTEYETFKHY